MIWRFSRFTRECRGISCYPTFPGCRYSHDRAPSEIPWRLAMSKKIKQMKRQCQKVNLIKVLCKFVAKLKRKPYNCAILPSKKHNFAMRSQWSSSYDTIFSKNLQNAEISKINADYLVKNDLRRDQSSQEVGGGRYNCLQDSQIFGNLVATSLSTPIIRWHLVSGF